MKAYELKSGKHTFNVEEFSSLQELVHINNSRPVTPQWSSRDDELKDDEIRSSFHGVKTKAEAYDLLVNGWTQHLDEMNALVNSTKTVNVQKRVAFKNDVIGFAPVVPLAMMNVPCSMINSAMKPVKSKVIKILYCMVDSCCATPQQFLDQGKKIMEAVITLERSGYRCELYSIIFFCDRSTHHYDALLLKVKEANQPLDVKRVMFPFTHPAMFRVIGFEWEDKCPTAKYMHGRGWPLYKTVDESEKLIKDTFGNEYVYVDCRIKDKSTSDVIKLFKGEAN